MKTFKQDEEWIALDKQADELEKQLDELRTGNWKGTKYLRALDEGAKEQARSLRRQLSEIDRKQREIEEKYK